MVLSAHSSSSRRLRRCLTWLSIFCDSSPFVAPQPFPVKWHKGGGHSTIASKDTVTDTNSAVGPSDAMMGACVLTNSDLPSHHPLKVSVLMKRIFQLSGVLGSDSRSDCCGKRRGDMDPVESGSGIDLESRESLESVRDLESREDTEDPVLRQTVHLKDTLPDSCERLCLPAILLVILSSDPFIFPFRFDAFLTLPLSRTRPWRSTGLSEVARPLFTSSSCCGQRYGGAIQRTRWQAIRR